MTRCGCVAKDFAAHTEVPKRRAEAYRIVIGRRATSQIGQAWFDVFMAFFKRHVWDDR